MDLSKYTIVTDLDETLLYQREMLPQNTAAIKSFVARGGRFTIATGRNHQSVLVSMPHVAELLNAPAILCNGVYLYDFEKKIRLAEECLSPEQAEALLLFVKTYFPHVPYRVSTFHGFRCERAEGYMQSDIAAYGLDAVEISPAGTWPREDWYKIVFRDEDEVLSRVRALFEEKMGGSGIVAFASGKRFLELQSEHCDKGTGLDWLRQQLPDRGGTVIACGDFENDLGMLRAADVAICPANATDEVKHVADHVLCHCKEGLLAEVVEMIEQGKI